MKYINVPLLLLLVVSKRIKFEAAVTNSQLQRIGKAEITNHYVKCGIFGIFLENDI